MSTGINIAPSSDLTVGTTAVTSGTDGRVFFQAGGVVQQDANFTYDNTLKRLGLKAVGTAATDIPLLIQDSAGTGKLFQVTGDGKHSFNMSPNTNFSLSIDQTNQNGGLAVYSSGQAIFTVAKVAGSVGYISVLNNGNPSFFSGTTSYFNHSLVVGGNSTSPGARLDVKAQGALSTDIAFRVRNSADTQTFFEHRGNGVTKLCGTGTVGGYAIPNDAFINAFILTTESLGANPPALTKAHLLIGESYISIRASVGGTTPRQVLQFSAEDYGGTVKEWSLVAASINDGALYFNGGAGTANQRMFLTDSATLNIGKNPMFNVNSGTNQLRIANGTAPSALAADTFALYSADITAGNAAPHFRTENGAIVKVYQETTGVAAATLVGGGGTTITDTDTFGGYTLQQIAQALKNLGILA